MAFQIHPNPVNGSDIEHLEDPPEVLHSSIEDPDLLVNDADNPFIGPDLLVNDAEDPDLQATNASHNKIQAKLIQSQRIFFFLQVREAMTSEFASFVFIEWKHNLADILSQHFIHYQNFPMSSILLFWISAY